MLNQGYSFEIEAVAGDARRGLISTAHGLLHTPAFLPVGTRASVRTLDTRDLIEAGAEGVLVNTYHMMLRPGADRVRSLGGLHAFMGWSGPILTDSGGFQVMSLDGKVSEEGVGFKSVYDGERLFMRPEDAIAVQEDLGADLIVQLDECPALPAAPDVVGGAMERSLRWAERCARARTRGDQALFCVVQGGVDPVLRARSAGALAAMGFDGYAIGGLSVGESAAEMLEALDASLPLLPADRPRYLMGVGDPYGMVEAVARGVDMFDCVLPTRLARHGTALTGQGRVQVKNAALAADDAPLDESCDCRTCSTISRAYLRHLATTGEELAKRALTIHNLAFLLGLMRRAREAVSSGGLADLRAYVAQTWPRAEAPAGAGPVEGCAR